jgi:hypothetical protein
MLEPHAKRLLHCSALVALVSLLGCAPGDELRPLGSWQAASVDGNANPMSTMLPGNRHEAVRVVRLVDFDGDGALDIVLGGPDAADLSAVRLEFWRNEIPAPVLCFALDNIDAGGPGGFASGDPPNGLSDLAFADYDRDGDPDLLVGMNGVPDQLWENHFDRVQGCPAAASAHFEERLEVFPEEGPSWATTSLAWADYTGDGFPDLAVGVWGEPSYTLVNRGNAVADTATRFEEHYLIDVDNDYEVRDIAWGVYSDGSSGSTLELALATESGPKIFSPAVGGIVWSDEESNAVYRLAWGDLNGDRRQDLAVAMESGLSIYPGGPGGALSGSEPQTGTVISQNWDGTESWRPTGMALADQNFDGRVDVGVVFQNDGVALLIGVPAEPGNGQVAGVDWGWVADSTVVNGASDVVWGAFIGDGALAMLISQEAEVVLGQLAYYLENDLDGPLRETFYTSPSSDSGLDPPHYSLAIGDYDRDGDLDLAVGSQNPGSDPCTESCNMIWNNRLGENAGAAFTRGRDLGLGDFKSLAWGDVDGDGDLDLAVGVDGGANLIYVNSGAPDYILSSTNLWTTSLAHMTDDTRSVAWGDMDGDGDLDLAVGNHSGSYSESSPDSWKFGKNRVWANDGDLVGFNQRWQEDQGDMSVPTTWTNEVSWGDWDNDGDLDLAVANGVYPGAGGSSEVSGVYENTGTGLGTFWMVGPPGRAYSAAWGDANGDGFLDLAVGRWGSQNTLYFNARGAPGWGGAALWEQGSVGFGAEDGETSSLVWGDYDLDGRLDLAESTWGAANAIYRNRPSGEPGSPADTLELEELGQRTDLTTPPQISNSKKIAFIDFDNDGDLDLLTVTQPTDGYYPQPLGLFVNHRRSTAVLPNTPSYALVGRPTLILEGEPPAGSGGAPPPPGAYCVTGEWHGSSVDVMFAGPGTTRIAEACRIPRGELAQVQVPIKLFDAESDPVSVRLEYSAQGGGLWQQATTAGYLGNMPTAPGGLYFLIDWLVAADPLHSDRVRLRLVIDRQQPTHIGAPQLTGREYSVSESFRVISACGGGLTTDNDNDDSPCLEDCDDNDPSRHPDATEVTSDDIDNDCDGFVRQCFLDRDGDGWGDDSGAVIRSVDMECNNANETLCGADVDGVLLEPSEAQDCGSQRTDCDDYDSSVHPAALDSPGDGIDHDCDGSDGSSSGDDDDTAGDDDDIGDDDDDDDGAPDDDDDGAPDDDDSCFANEDCYTQPPGCALECSAASTRASGGPPLALLSLLLGLGRLRRRRRSPPRAHRRSHGPLLLAAAVSVCVLLLALSAAVAEESERPAPADASSAEPGDPPPAEPGDPPPAEPTAEAEQALEAAAQVAIAALAIHDEHCARMAGNRRENADALLAVAPVWKQVTDSYQSTGASYLLYWSGVLGLCLGQRDNAGDDLRAFLAQEGENPEFTGLTRDARRRLRRLGKGKVGGLAGGKTPMKARRAARAGSEKASGSATSTRRARRARWGPLFMVGAGLGVQGLLTAGGNENEQFGYLALGLDVSLRIAGPLRFEVGLYPGISGPARNYVGDDNGKRSLLWLLGIGPVLQFETKVRPRVGLAIQLAPNPDGDIGRGEGGGDDAARVDGGAVITLGLDIPFGSSPLSLRLGSAWGGLSSGLLLARGMAELVYSP